MIDHCMFCLKQFRELLLGEDSSWENDGVFILYSQILSVPHFSFPASVAVASYLVLCDFFPQGLSPVDLRW